jgi:glycosyltransferase involved in cell wall biosynthesis
MQPKVSIIIPIYNVEEFLACCLESVLNQTLKEIEIICVNDGSTDNSLEILEGFAVKDDRVVVISQKNKGLGATRNIALLIAKGEYIGFVDSDDWVELNFFESLYNTAKKYDADIACGNIVRKYPSSKTSKRLDIKGEKLYYYPSEKYRITEAPRRCYAWNKIYKRSEIEAHGVRFLEKAYFEDVAFTIRALYYLTTLVTVPESTYFYRVNYKSITRDMSELKQQDLLAARQDFINFSKEHNIVCDEKFYIKRKTVYKCFGVPLMKIYEWETIKKYYLFASIPVFEKRISL